MSLVVLFYHPPFEKAFQAGATEEPHSSGLPLQIGMMYHIFWFVSFRWNTTRLDTSCLQIRTILSVNY
ncbi:MAG: hypothetical protein A2Y72_07410 [Chloroflexi bacterium RBG_13_53_26]|nr:MAG: hypothetical protein A2Y72_07410 [Chloroflexi bacterium RBG_13_53_26]